MEGHRPQANYDIPQKGEDKHPRVVVGEYIAQAPDAEPHKHQVGERVDYFGAVEADVVILQF